MQRRNILLAMTAGLLTLGLVAPAHAEKPPSWAIGTFSGTDWKGNRIELTFESDGDVKRYVWRNGRSEYKKGFYRGDKRFTFDGETWELVDTSGGIKVDKRNDDRDWLTLRRGSSDGSSGRPTYPGEVDDNRPPRPGQNSDDYAPTWAWGKFEGQSEKDNRDVEVSINRNSITIKRKTGKTRYENGRWRNGYADVGGKQYRLERNGRGLRLTNRNDSRDYLRLSRTD